VNLILASTNRSSADADAPSYSSTLRIGFENKRIFRNIRLGQLHRRWNADSSSIPQAMQIGSSIRPVLCRCLFNGQCPVMSPTKILNLDLGSLNKYLVKPGLGLVQYIYLLLFWGLDFDYKVQQYSNFGCKKFYIWIQRGIENRYSVCWLQKNPKNSFSEIHRNSYKFPEVHKNSNKFLVFLEIPEIPDI
jgi:hypothetical protein